jgi:quercetin dioxygenase-like cupin family protein
LAIPHAGYGSCETERVVSAFEDLRDIAPQQLFDGYLARALHGDRITLAIVEIEPDAGLPEHNHENEQLGMVLRGSLTFRVGDEERTLSAGGTWRIPSNTPHSARAGPDGAVALDVFTPTRTDWKSLPEEERRSPLWP